MAKKFDEPLDFSLEEQAPSATTKAAPQGLKEHKKRKNKKRQNYRAATFKIDADTHAALQRYVLECKLEGNTSITQGDIVTAGIEWYLKKHKA